jgi:hypothetical protein
MKFWDASAIVPLLFAEGSSRRLEALVVEDSLMLVWWGSEVECVSAIARVERDGMLEQEAVMRAGNQIVFTAKIPIFNDRCEVTGYFNKRFIAQRSN